MSAPTRARPLPIRRLAVIGAGKMGETLIDALVSSEAVGREAVVATALHDATLERVGAKLGVATTRDNRAAAAGADLVLLAVKPQSAAAVVEELAGVLGPDSLLVTIVAGATLAYVEGRLPAPVPVVRAMPNTPALVRAGMTALCRGSHAGEPHLALARSVFDRVGRTLVLDEKHFDAVTGLSASGPAFLYVVIEALAEGGVKVGLPRKVATELAAQACLGAGLMVVETGSHPALLKDEVTTPAGCTVDGLLRLEEGGLRVALIKAVVEASLRAKDLGGGALAPSPFNPSPASAYSAP
jgi:pyrroline-5-carboxylate reductase